MTISEQKLARLIDEHEINRTLYQWVHALDTGSFDEVMDCYAPGGTMHVFNHDYKVETEEEFHKFVDMNVAHKGHLHLNCTPRVRFDGDTAKVESYIVRLDAVGESKEPLVRAFAVYRDDFVRSEDGRWRISFRYVDRVGFSTVGVDPSHPAVARLK